MEKESRSPGWSSAGRLGWLGGTREARDKQRASPGLPSSVGKKQTTRPTTEKEKENEICQSHCPALKGHSPG